MPKRTVGLIAGLGVSVMLASCGGGGGSSDAPASGDAGKDGKGPIVIGAAMASTGFMQPFDNPALAGAKLAVEDINAKGGVNGRQLKIDVIDSKSDKAQAATAATELIDGKKANVLLVSCDFDFGSPAALVAQQKGLLAMGCAGSPKFGVQGIGRNAFTFDTVTPGEGAAGAEWAFQKRQWKKAYTVTDTSIDYTKTLTEYFKTRFKELGGEVVGSDTFINDDKSMASQIGRIQQAANKPDFIYLSSCLPGAATFLRQLRSAGVDTPIVSGICLDGEYWLKAVPNLSNVYFTPYVSTFGDDPSTDVNDIIDRVSKSEGNVEQRLFGPIGYSAVQAFAIAAERAKSLETDALLEQLESFKEEPLAVGPTTFSATSHGDATRPFAVVEIKNGKPAYLETWKPQKPPAAGL